MLSKNEVKISRHGHIYFGYRAAQALGITGWEWLKITPYREHTLMRICMTSVISEAGSHVVKLNKVRGSKVPMASSCIKFADELAARFGEFKSLNLRYVICPGGIHGEGDSVLISVDNPPNTKPAPDSDGNIPIPEQEEEVEAREAYFAEFKKPLGTISKPTELPALGKPATAPRTRPLPEGLPEWLYRPLSRGGQVQVFTRTGESGWVLGVYVDPIFGAERPLVVVLIDSDEEPNLPDSYLIEAVTTSPPNLRPAAECFLIAKELNIDLSSMQINAIFSGGVPHSGHGLPVEMFE